jgi:UDP-glucose 4-epimerase
VNWDTAPHWQDIRVLVTGAGGFLGGATCRRLLELGAEVHGTVRRSPAPDGVESHVLDLPDGADALVRRLQPQVVLHFASPIELDHDPHLYERLRRGILDTSAAVAGACRATGARLLQVGTCAEYGEREAPYHEDQAPRPTAPYGVLKAAATHLVMAMARTGGLRATVVRPFRTYGPGDMHSVVAQACRGVLDDVDLALSDGAQVREWNYVDPMVAGLLSAAACPAAEGRLLNLGGGPRASVRALVEAIWDLGGADPAQLRFGDRPRRASEAETFWADTSAADALIGPLPHVPLSRGLEQTLEWTRFEAPDRAPHRP